MDSVAHVHTVFDTIKTIAREFQDDEVQATREMYPRILPPSDLPRLYSLTGLIERSRHLKEKATALRGDAAISFIDCLTEERTMIKKMLLSFLNPIMRTKVLDKYPCDKSRSDVLRLLQRVVEASSQLPSQLWISALSDMQSLNDGQGSEAAIFKCRYQGTAVAARRFFKSKSVGTSALFVW